HDGDAPMPKDGIFSIMSMTKPITAMGIMVLQDDGKLAITDPVEKYLPEFKGQRVLASNDKGSDTQTLVKVSRPITLKDLLTHTSGQPDLPAGLDDLMRTRNRTLSEVVAIDSQQPLLFQPGTQWKYSSAGMDTLGRIIEVVSGQSYEDFLAERFFKPLAMNDTGFYVEDKNASRIAEVCGLRQGKLVASTSLPNARVAVPTVKPMYPCPAGGLYSTAADLSRLYRALLNGGQLDGVRVIPESTLHTMTRTQTGELETGFSPGMSYGYGFAVVKKPQGVTGMLSPGTFGHGGAFGTQIWADPVKNVYYILLIQRTGLKNSDSSDMRMQFQTLAAAAVDGK
ncbi:MAG TPA: serine hydrolase domain-containing protein, partial [Pirellulales bacterium]